MKYDIFNRFTEEVQFAAEIDATDQTSRSVKVGLSVKWALKNQVNLSGANISWANLSEANLSGANLSGANLYTANLSGADLSWANLGGADLSGANLYRANLYRANLYTANLSGANLSWANLSGANLYRANLYRANLYTANLSGADLSEANLSGANLYTANLSGADLSGADLSGGNGVNDWIKCIQIDRYPIIYTSDVMQIGCERHQINEWREFDDARILEMDGKSALKFWRKYKDWIFQTIELCPAKPTQEADQ